MADEFITLKDLAAEFGIHHSNVRPYLRKCGIKTQRRRTPNSRNQLTDTLSREEADFVRAKRREEGYLGSLKPVEGDVGLFYVIQLVPELDATRIKLGFANDISTRMIQHRTSAPTARVLKTWPCKRSWESTVMDALVACDCQLIANEVFECSDIQALLARGDALFGLLPEPSLRPSLSELSPFNT